MNRETSPNIYGIETEYSVMITNANDEVFELVGVCHSQDTHHHLNLFEQPHKKGSDSLEDDDYTGALRSLGIVRGERDMLSNGGRFYIDPSGPEYATPETTTAEEAVNRMYDGDEIVFGVFRYLQKKEAIQSFQLNRRIVDHNRTSRGIHINTNTGLEQNPNERQITQLAALNVAKGAIFGSGGLMIDEYGKTDYYHSPRLALTDCLNTPTHTDRPLVRAPFSPDYPGNRIESTSGDALNFAWPMRASMIMTNAVVSLMELDESHSLPQLVPEDAIISAKSVGKNGKDGALSCVRNGEVKLRAPLDVLRQMAELCLAVDDIEEYLDVESRQVLPEVVGVAEKMQNDPESMANQVESVARKLVIERKLGSQALDSEKACRLDYAWDWIGNGIAERLREKGVVGWQGFTQPNSPSVIKKRLITPPQDTRAKTRGDFILTTNGQYLVDWSSISSNDKPDLLAPIL